MQRSRFGVPFAARSVAPSQASIASWTKVCWLHSSHRAPRGRGPTRRALFGARLLGVPASSPRILGTTRRFLSLPMDGSCLSVAELTAAVMADDPSAVANPTQPRMVLITADLRLFELARAISGPAASRGGGDHEEIR